MVTEERATNLRKMAREEMGADAPKMVFGCKLFCYEVTKVIYPVFNFF
jgi:hypothetical protein